MRCTRLSLTHIYIQSLAAHAAQSCFSITARSFARPHPPSTRDASGETMTPQEHVSLFWPHQRRTTMARTATTDEIRPFRFDVPEEQLVDLRRRIAATKWPEQETVKDASQGVQL